MRGSGRTPAADTHARCGDNTRMEISLIVALDRNYAIGRGGEMPWHLPDDLKRFKALTLGKATLMGSKTARAIGRVLPGRENLVMTRGDTPPYAEQRVVHSLDEAIRIAGEGELAVIGGGEIFTLALPRATHMYLTWVDVEVAPMRSFRASIRASGRRRRASNIRPTRDTITRSRSSITCAPSRRPCPQAAFDRT